MKPLQGIDVEKVRQRLPESYLSPLPVRPSPEAAVRELNNGRVWASEMFGIERIVAGPDDDILVKPGDSVTLHPRGAVPTPEGRDCAIFLAVPGRRLQGRITEIYISDVTKEWACSVRLLLTADLIKDLDGSKAGVPTAQPLPGYEGGLWETCVLLHHVHLSSLLGVCEVDEVPSTDRQHRQARFCLLGHYTEKRVFQSPWKLPTHPSERRRRDKGRNPLQLPIAKLGLVAWADGFQTFTRASHSTTAVSMTHAALPYPLRNSVTWVRNLSFLPPGVDHNEALRIIFWPLKKLERGVVVPAATPQKQAFLRSSLYSFVADSKQANESADTPTQGSADFCCPYCFVHTSENAYCDTVSGDTPPNRVHYPCHRFIHYQ